jgi:DHA1 family bicyclomycin/chloramphenicol resistance-like MFS transporter
MARYALVLGALFALGPLAIDMYLPAMPAMAGTLSASAGEVQASLMTFFLGMSSGQLIFGPVSDAIGRRPPIFFGLALFIAAGIACALAPNASFLTGARLLQGLGASVGFVVGAAVIRDRYTGVEYARLFALCILVLGVSPVLAPLAGSLVISVAPWRAIFWITSSLGLAVVALTVLLLPETHPPQARSLGVAAALGAYRRVLSDRHFVGLTLANAFGQGAFFAYLAGSSFVLIEGFGLSPLLFSLVFAMNAIGLVGGAQFAPNLIHRFGPERLILAASGVLVVAAAIPVAAELTHRDSLWVLLPALFVTVTALSQLGAPTMALALRDHGKSAGTASAIMGAAQIGSGALASGVVAALANGSAAPMIGTIAACGLCAFALYRIVLGRKRMDAIGA